ncbi:MAG: LysR family transcriptional regulator [Achromobacter sp.]
MNLSLRDIEYFLAAVEYGNLERAALSCSVSQPALSKALQRLEADTGLPLLDRGGRSLRLTSAGELFLEHARKLWAEYQDAIRHAMELRVGQAGLLRVGVTGATVDSVIMPAMARLLPRRPALRVQLMQGLSDELHAHVASGRLDLAVTPVYSDVLAPLHQAPIMEDRLCVAASARHALATRAKLTLRDLDGQRWILPRSTSMARQALEAKYAEAGIPFPAAALEVEHYSKGALELLAHSELLALLPQSALVEGSGVVALPLAIGRTLRRSIALISRLSTTWTPLMIEFQRAVMTPRETPAADYAE